MKKDKHFYSHIVDTTSLIDALQELGLANEEVDELVSLAHDNLHHTVLDAILSELSEDDKKTFLLHIAEEKHDKIWELLFAKVENIEQKIKNAADTLTKELHTDIQAMKEKK